MSNETLSFASLRGGGLSTRKQPPVLISSTLVSSTFSSRCTRASSSTGARGSLLRLLRNAYIMCPPPKRGHFSSALLLLRARTLARQVETLLHRLDGRVALRAVHQHRRQISARVGEQ